MVPIPKRSSTTTTEKNWPAPSSMESWPTNERSKESDAMRTLIALLFGCLVVVNHAAEAPLPRAHAHNDYEHTHPLTDALDRGFGSVEADVYPIDGDLLVAHDFKNVKKDRTLESLYLAPLKR